MNYFMEVAKLRAARLLWARLVKGFEPKDPRSLSLRTHSQTSGWSLTAQDVINNVVRTCVEAMAATHGGTQSLHTNAFDEALALPTDFSARIARNTQLFIQDETGTCRTVDPWGGSYFVERLTHDLAERAWAHIEEVEKAGGMAKAIEQGIPKLRIEEAAARTQARIDSGRQTVVGVNKYRLDEPEHVDVLKVDNRSVREQQIAKLAELKSSRDELALKRALDALTAAAGSERRQSPGARGRRGPGQGHGRRDHRGAGEGLGPARGRDPLDHRGLRQGGGCDGDRVGACRKRVEAFAEARGPPAAHPDRQDGPGRPRPRPEGDRHGLRRSRLRRRYRPLVPDARARRRARRSRTTSTSSARSSLAAGHLTLVPELKAALEKQGRGDIMIVVGGVIPPQDYDDAAGQAGAKAIFPPGTVIADAAIDLLDKLAKELGHALGRGRIATSSWPSYRRLPHSRPASAAGDRAMLARAITLVESRNATHRAPGREPCSRPSFPSPTRSIRRPGGSASPAFPESARARSSTGSARC